MPPPCADPAPLSGAEAGAESGGPDLLLQKAAALLAARFDIDHPTLQIERTACAAHMACPSPAGASEGCAASPLSGSPLNGSP